ncbi:MAG: hypothetical protein OSB21_03620 [Myxococcota bacterium]|nr:hypothetical protein [Myxococcota bacterium]
MKDELARIRPRGRQDVEVCLDKASKGSTIILRSPGGEPMPLTAIGYFAFLQMDSETSLSRIESRIEDRFKGAGVVVEHLCGLVERLQAKALLFEDGRAVRARATLSKAGLNARRERAPSPADREHKRNNEDVAALVHAGWAALVGSEFPRAVSKFRSASEALPSSWRLARLVDVLERIGAGEDNVEFNPWVGIERVVRQAVAARRCPACGGDLHVDKASAFRCLACDGVFEA